MNTKSFCKGENMEIIKLGKDAIKVMLDKNETNEYNFSLKSAVLDSGADFCVIEIYYKDGILLPAKKKTELCNLMLNVLPKKYKYETQKLRDAFDLEGLFGRFIVESNIFLDNTRSGDWYRGMDVNVVLLPFREVLESFDSMSHLIGHKEIVLSKIHNIRKIINHYDMATFAERKLVNDLISDVIRFLQREIHFSVRETSEMVR